MWITLYSLNDISNILQCGTLGNESANNQGIKLLFAQYLTENQSHYRGKTVLQGKFNTAR